MDSLPLHELLDACRPGSDDLAQPEMAAVRAELEANPTARRHAGRVEQFDRNVAAALHDVPLPEGQHYKHELLGLNVVDEHNNPLGELVEILETGANDVYIVRNDSGKDILLPNIPSVILDLDVGARLMRVHLLEGL